MTDQNEMRPLRLDSLAESNDVRNEIVHRQINRLVPRSVSVALQVERNARKNLFELSSKERKRKRRMASRMNRNNEMVTRTVNGIGIECARNVHRVFAVPVTIPRTKGLSLHP
jgi:hypothetical protein